MLDIEVNEVVRYGEEKFMGIVKEIRVIDTAKFVQKFSGNAEKVMVKIYTQLGTASIWAKEYEIFKVNTHDAKEYNSKFK